MTPARRPRVALVVPDVGFHHAVPHILAEIVVRLHRDVDFVLLSPQVGEEIEPLVEWHPISLAKRFRVRTAHALCFFLVPLELRRLNVDLVQTVSIYVPNRVDSSWVQWSHLADQELGGRPWGNRVAAGMAQALSVPAERWFFRRRVRMLAATCSRSRAELERRFPGVPTTVVPNGVDPDRFRPNEAERARGRDGLAAGAVVCLFVGYDSKRKGLDLAIEGLAHAVRAGAGSLQLWVVGGGDRAAYRALAARHSIEERVRFFGAVPDPVGIFQSSDVFLFPSRYDEFGLVLLEAAACELPTVATDAGVAWEVIGKDEAGLRVDLSPSSIAAALVRLAADPELRARLGAEGRRRSFGYTWDHTAAAMLEHYHTLLASPRA